MGNRLSTSIATCALTACAVCHIWALVELLRRFTNGWELQGGASAPLMLLYMIAVFLFNWCALTSGSEKYRHAALIITILHLAGALLQGAAAEAILTTGARTDGWIMTWGLALPAALNLPMNSMDVVYRQSSMMPWVTTAFFAINLAVVAARMRRLAEAA